MNDRSTVISSGVGRVRDFGARCLAVLALAGAAAGAGAQVAAEVITVQRGDTLSQIAARFPGGAQNWRSLYDARRSNIPNPDMIVVGQRLELVTEASGARYLRALPGAPAATAAATPAVGAAARAPAAAAAPATAAPAAPAARTAQAAPAPAAPAAPATIAPAAPAAAAETPLVIGLVPNIPAPALMSQYENIKKYLERQTNLKVQLVVPPNFKAFFDAMMAAEYDVAVAPPHMARVAQVDRGLVPLGIYEPRIAALFVAPAEGGAASAREATGKAIGFANPTSLVAMFGQQWLRNQGMEPGRDYEMKAARTDLGVGRMMLIGEAAAAIMSNGEFRALPPDEGARMKIVESFARIPNFIWLGKPGLPRERADAVRQAMRGFFADKDEGTAFGRATGLSAFVDVDDATMRELDPFVAPTRRALGGGR